MDYTCCTLCPRMCKADRTASSGYCGCPDHILAARAALHHWEEPCISGTSNDQGGRRGRLFSGCTLRCCFCQNHTISSGRFGTPLTAGQLGETFLLSPGTRRL